MSKLIKIISTPTNAVIKDAPSEVKNLVSDVLSYKVEAAEHMKTSWDGELSFYDYRKDKFPAGFVRLVAQTLKRNGYKVIVSRKPCPAPLGPKNPKVDDYPADPRYDYQDEIPETLIKLRAMIARVTTGGGKSRVFKLCQQRIGLPTLFVTTRKSLMYQMAEDFKEHIGGSIGILGDGEWSPNYKGVNFAIVDTLTSRLEVPDANKEVEKALLRNQDKIEKEIKARLDAAGVPSGVTALKMVPKEIKTAIARVRADVEKELEVPRDEMIAKIEKKLIRQKRQREETLEFLKHMGFLCLEEAHEVGSDGFFGIAQSCVNAHYRLALTATPFMRDDQGANMRLMAATGPVGIQVSEQLLIERGILATPKFCYANVQPPKKLFRSTAWQSAYRIGIMENEDRNKVILKDVQRMKAHGLTSMVLIARKEHGELLAKRMKALGIRCAFIFGDHKQAERKAALKALGKGEIDCLIGSTILDVGVDVPSVGYVGLAGAGKAEVATRQRIGRGLRAKKSGPNVCFVRDFEDMGNNHLRAHAKERRRIVEETPGFAENIVSNWDFKGLGFEPV